MAGSIVSAESPEKEPVMKLRASWMVAVGMLMGAEVAGAQQAAHSRCSLSVASSHTDLCVASISFQSPSKLSVLVQPEMERGRSPLESISPFGQDHCSSVLRLRSRA
jgi:hypothetical protein